MPESCTVPRRKGGRPRGSNKRLEPLARELHLRVTSDLYDRIDRFALKVNMPPGKAARIMLERYIQRMEALLNQ